MKKIKSGDAAYKTFQDVLTGYRLTNTLKVAHESGVFEVIGEGDFAAEEICKKSGWDNEKGLRFIEALFGLGFLEKADNNYSLSPFALKFLVKSSENYQGNSIEFEERLIESWNLLGSTLEKGERVYGTSDKSPEEYDKSLEKYLGAMDDAAKVRACELWDHVNPEKEGLILDAGAGSGAFIIEFLNRHKNWKGIFCDLKDVVAKAGKKREIKKLAPRIDFIETNLLENEVESRKFKNINAQIVVLSNLVHCQGEIETMKIFSHILDSLSNDGVVIVHDFFTDCGWRGAMYDIHMMLNTYNGRTYTIKQMRDMLAEFGLKHSKKIMLNSGSTLLAVSKKPVSKEFI